MTSIWSAIRERWQAETDGAGLAVVRIAVALSVLIEMLDTALSGGVTDLIVEPQFNFKYAFFAWLGRPMGLMPFVLVWTLAAIAIAVLVGWRTRWTASLMAMGYAYWFLFDAANYSDHGYLVCLLAGLVAWLPSNRWASADAYMVREPRTNVPGWTVELVRTQLILVFCFFSLALLNRDWLTGAPLIAWAETEAENHWLLHPIAGQWSLWRGLAWFLPVFYLALGPLLYWQRTRIAALIVLGLFHLFDQFTFQLSVSPLLLTAACLIFCDPAKIRTLGNWLAGLSGRLPLSGPIWKAICKLGWLVDACVSWFDDTPLWGKATAGSAPPIREKPKPSVNSGKKQVVTTRNSPPEPSRAPQWAIALWLLFQVWMPLRYLTLESNPDWSDLATTFAWRGQHRDKQCELKLSVIQPSQELQWPLDPTDEFPVPMAIFYTPEKLESLDLSEGILKDLISGPVETLSDRLQSMNLPEGEAQRILDNYRTTLSLRLGAHQYEQLVQRPELIRQYARRIADVMSLALGERVQIQADLQVKLNHRPAQDFFTDSTKFDLSEIPTAFELSNRITRFKSNLPGDDQRVAFAKEWAEQRRIELEQNFDIASPKHPAQTGEPVKLPALSDDDERWYQETYGAKS